MQVHAFDATFYVSSNLEVEQGGTITVPVSVSDNPGFAATTLMLQYDPYVLQIVNVNHVAEAMPLSPQFALSRTPGEQWMPFLNPNLVDWSQEGVIANVTFQVNPNAPVGLTSMSLGFTAVPDGTPANSGGQVLHGAATVPGNVLISAPLADDTDVEPPEDEDTLINDPPQDVRSEPEPDHAGRFIGMPHVRDDVGVPVVSAAVFGPVPQTGVQGIAGYVIAMIACFIGSALLWILILCAKFRNRKNGKQIID